MCGIAGSYSSAPENGGVLAERVAGMTAVLRHRGPDAEGIWLGERNRLALGHRRLAIIDLSRDGQQPMVSADGQRALAYNGEIYNFIELRAELEAGGHPVTHGHSDTAVLLTALEAWGMAATLPKLVGMFAFAWWDGAALHLARDRAGKKPLYHARREGRFLFASEIKALRAVAGRALSISEEAIHHYLSLGFIPAPLTIYREVTELPAGCWMTVRDGHPQAPQPYWQLPRERRTVMPFHDAVAEADRLLSLAVQQRLRADVPVGLFLSGGIDSGLLTAYAARHSTQPVRTFTISFRDAATDEAPLAAQVAQRYATRHQAIRLDPDLETVLPQVAAAYDEPFGDPSALPTYVVSQAAGAHMKVVLSGEGADEVFGGYRRHRAIQQFTRIRRLTGFLPAALWRGLDRALPLPGTFRSPYAFLHRFVRGLGESPLERYLTWTADTFTEQQKAALWQGPAPAATTAFLAAHYADLAGADPLSHFMALDFRLSMSDCLLTKMDIATMAHSLEARCPFLDHRLVDWAYGLHPATLMPGMGMGNKPILRSLARTHLPPQVAAAPKRGFEIPLIQWMTNDLRGMVRETCLSAGGIGRELFGKAALEAFLDRRTPMDDNRWSRQVWLLLMLSLWKRQAS